MRTSALFLVFLLANGIALGAGMASEEPPRSSDFVGSAFEQSAAPIDQSGVATSDELALATDVWPLVGEARLKVLFWEVYDSALFTPSGRWQGGAPYQLSLHYLRDIPAAKLVEQTEKAWQEQGRSHPQQSEWLALLVELWPDISEGDNLVFGLTASGESAFWFNGSLIGSVEDRDFGALFGGIWLDPDTPRPGLRAQLIGPASELAQKSPPD
jgi:hypothetical protein